MLRFCVDADLIGTEKHLVYDDGSFSWNAQVPVETFHLSGNVKFANDWCMDSLLQLGGAKLTLLPPRRFVDAMSIVIDDRSVRIPWEKVMPAATHRAFVKNLINGVVEAMVTAPADYHRNTWVPGNVVLRSLQRAKIAKRSWDDLMEAGVGNVHVVSTFMPDMQGYADPIVYDRFGTLTGRLTVKSGPNIMTLKREYRNLLRSSHGENGSIVMLDFAALEVRVMLYEAGRRCENPDIYAMIAEEMGEGISRKAVKGAVISELYGSSKHALGEALGIKGKELDAFVRKVRTYFNTDELLERVKKQFVASGRLTNRYGRPVLVDEPSERVFINYYAQSTGADVALLGFSSIVDKLSNELPRVRPLYLLHDALFLDVHNDDLEKVLGIKDVQVKGYVQKYLLKAEVVK